MNYYTIVVIALPVWINTVNAEPSFKEQYLKYYTKQLKPILEEQLNLETSIETEEDADAQISFLANRIAECQLLAIEDYPKKYKEASMIPVVEGEDIRKVTNDVNSIMQTDIDSGELPNSEFTAMVKTATEKYKACLN